MNWESYIRGFKSFLRLECSLSENSVEAYCSDVDKLIQYLQYRGFELSPAAVGLQHLKDFIRWVNEMGMSDRTQARVISGLRAFYNYLSEEKIITDNPTLLLESPKLRTRLPDTLEVEDIDSLISAIDLSTPEGERNKAILETLFSCGLRVSELVNLRISDLHLDISFIRVKGKGNKERLVPIGAHAAKLINGYMLHIRNRIQVKPGNEDILFLNRRGSKLSRVMVFLIIRQLAQKIELKKNISPHTFRHSFATFLIDGGADLRAVQEMLGHESITTTEIYTHLDRDYLRDAIIRFHPRS